MKDWRTAAVIINILEIYYKIVLLSLEELLDALKWNTLQLYTQILRKYPFFFKATFQKLQAVYESCKNDSKYFKNTQKKFRLLFFFWDIFNGAITTTS